MRMLTGLFAVVFSFTGLHAQVNRNEPIDTLELLYNEDEYLIDRHFDRDQIPLDGAEVSMIPYRDGEHFGFADKQGNITLKPLYEEVHAVYREGAIVKNDNGYGLINASGKAIIPLQFRQLTKEKGLYHGLLSIIVPEIKSEYRNTAVLSMHYDSTGRFLFEELSHNHTLFQNNDTLCWFRFGTVYHIRSRTGALRKVFRWKPDQHFVGVCNNLLIFGTAQEDKSEVTYEAKDLNDNLKFKFNLPYRVNGIFQLSEHLFGHYSEDGDFLFCDEKGYEKPYGVISETVGFFRHTGDFFSQQYFTVKDYRTEKYGVIDRYGKAVIPFEYQHIYSLGRDLYLCDANKILNSKGEKVSDYVVDQITLQYLSVYGLDPYTEDGMIPSKYYKDTLFNDQNGKLVRAMDMDKEYVAFKDVHGKTLLTLPSTYGFVSNFSDGLAAFTDSNNQLGFIDTSGKVVIAPQYELTLAGSYPMPYVIVPSFIHGFAYIKSHKGYIDKHGKEFFRGKRIQDHYNFSH